MKSGGPFKKNDTAAKIRGFFAALFGAAVLFCGVSFAFRAGVDTYLYVTSSKAPFITSAWQKLVEQTGFLKQIEYFFTKPGYFKMAARYTDAMAETTLQLDTVSTDYSRLFLDIVRVLPDEVTLEDFSFAPGILVIRVKADSYSLVQSFSNKLYVVPEVRNVQVTDDSQNRGPGSYTIVVTVI